MAGKITPSQPTPGFFDHPIFTPAKYVLAIPKMVLYTLPATVLHALSSKVSSVAQSFVGYFVSIGVFSFAEWQRSWLKSKIIDVYTGGPRGLLKGNFSPERLEKAFASLENVGGVRTPIYTKNGTKLDTMIIRHKTVRDVIEKNGGKIVQTLPISNSAKNKEKGITECKENHLAPDECVDILIPQEKSPKWDSFYKNTLLNLGMEKVSIQMENGELVQGFIINHWNEHNPRRPKDGQCCVRINSPTESFASAKKDIMRRIFLGLDVLCYDPPGTWKSEGVASEGAYYLAAETMVEKAVNTYGYQWNDIWADGFCLGGAIATYLKKKYHDQGINLFVQNTFANMQETLGTQVFPACHIAPFGLKGVKSGDPKIEALVTEDGLNSEAKLESLIGREKKGISIVVNTDTDTTVGPDSHQRYAAAADKVSAKTHAILFVHPKRNENGHRSDVLSDLKTWQKVVTHIVEKDPLPTAPKVRQQIVLPPLPPVSKVKEKIANPRVPAHPKRAGHSIMLKG